MLSELHFRFLLSSVAHQQFILVVSTHPGPVFGRPPFYGLGLLAHPEAFRRATGRGNAEKGEFATERGACVPVASDGRDPIQAQ
eukprot:589262-Pyramimonas_sp.AAC.1